MRRALLLTLLACACSRSDPEVDRLLARLRKGDKEGRALADLGPDHADGIPAVLETLRDDDRRFVQLTCLEALLSMGAGEEARPAIEERIAGRDALVADRAALVHWKLYGGRFPGLDRLLARADAELNARQLLRRAPPLPPAVADEVAAEAGLLALAALGPPVRTALPRIEKALESDVADVRIRAAEAHFRVSGRLQPALAVLIREFEVENVFLRQRIYAIWLDMLSAHPDEMRAELAQWRENGSGPLREMAIQMLGE